MSDGINYNHRHRPSGGIIAGSTTGKLTVGDIRDAIAEFPDDAEVIFGPAGPDDHEPRFKRFKTRGAKLLQFEFDRS